MLVAIAVLATLFAAYYGWQYWQLVSNGATAPAESIKVMRQLTVGKTIVGDPYRYFAEYTFTDAGGRVHGACQSIGRDLYDSFAHGGDRKLTVFYSRARPAVNVVDMQAARVVPLILAALSAMLWLVALLRLARG